MGHRSPAPFVSIIGNGAQGFPVWLEYFKIVSNQYPIRILWV